MKRSFTSLDPEEALQAAIAIEKRNAALYRSSAETFSRREDELSREIAEIFWEMAIEEDGHCSLLMKKYTERYGSLNLTACLENLAESIELPELEDGNVFAMRIADLPGDICALQVALRAEMMAQEYYRGILAQTPSGELRELYTDLAQAEQDHALYLAVKLGLGMAPNAIESIDATVNCETESPRPLRMLIYGYSTEADTQKLKRAYADSESEGLLQALTRLTPAGRIQIPGEMDDEIAYVSFIRMPQRRKMVFLAPPKLSGAGAKSFCGGEITLDERDRKLSSGIIYPATRVRTFDGEIQLEPSHHAWRLSRIVHWTVNQSSYRRAR